MQRKLRDHGSQIDVEQRQDLGLYEIEVILNKNDISWNDYPPMPLPLSSLEQQLGNRLIGEQPDYDQ